jgi:hypothetical protein
MPKRISRLSQYFKPTKYSLRFSNSVARLTIEGQKLPPPSQRITFHQIGHKILDCHVKKQRKNDYVELTVERINYLASFEQLRIHTREILYPGRYRVELSFRISPDQIKRLQNGDKNRKLLPSVDEADVWEIAELEIKQ